MPLLNFQRRFVQPIQLGIKCHTIRAHRKYPIKPGQPLYLYCGLRHPGAFRILPDPQTCVRVQPIALTADGHPRAFIDETELDTDECERLAVADGFENWREMAFF
jgi:hypothetical protein